MSEVGIRVEWAADYEGVLVVTIDNPPANAMKLSLFRNMRDLFLNVRDDYVNARCIILTGEGKIFCAGADTRELAARTTEMQIARSEVSRSCFDAIRRCALPVVGAVNGAAVGAGVVLAACCDIVLASDNAHFSLTEVLIGALGGTRHTARLVPNKLMRYMALTGQRVSAADVARYGGVLEVTSQEELIGRALEIAGQIASLSPYGVQLMKESINLTEELPVTEGYRIEQLYTTLASNLPDAAEAGSAMREKRKPNWTGQTVSLHRRNDPER
ncbi:enoyl-CoA hydratase-related protein [Sphingomonas oligophenolica]|uniref:Enoyl-CoA hydratase-related protein n=1 Tax=Sphingomonas oligophenolica TaxID=301154 RepID=A0ABU9YA01_9SPHN